MLQSKENQIILIIHIYYFKKCLNDFIFKREKNDYSLSQVEVRTKSSS